jgi:hypothetical protein
MLLGAGEISRLFMLPSRQISKGKEGEWHG